MTNENGDKLANEIKSQQIQVIELYKELTQTDDTVLPFMELLSKKLETAISEVKKDAS